MTGSKHRNRTPFQDLWEQVLIDEASINRQISACNQACQQWGEGAPLQALADLQERKRLIKRSKTFLNQWLQQNPKVSKSTQLAIAEDLVHMPGCQPEYTLDQWDLYVACQCAHNGSWVDESGNHEARRYRPEGRDGHAVPHCGGVWDHHSSGEEEPASADEDVVDSMDWN